MSYYWRMRSVKAFTRISGPGRSRTALVARAFILAACFMITHWASPRCQAGEHQAGRGLQAVLDTFLAENEIAPGLSVHVICP
ncbi:MAG TPA: hypothetical protein VLA34_11920, partial [Candidatus Krumholzibacterium sp.]|nr:hypothetical protein [Candidatus Krumholzibacterium sp.]